MLLTNYKENNSVYKKIMLTLKTCIFSNFSFLHNGGALGTQNA